MNKIISVLQKTTRQTAVGLVVLGLIVVAAPMAVFATIDDNEHPTGHTPVEICHKGEIKTVDDDAVSGHLGHGDFVITNDNRDTCKKEGNDNDDNNDTGTLTVTKVIRGTESAHFSDFSFIVNDGSSIAFAEDGTNVLKEKEGEYSVHEVDVDNYTTEYSSNAEGHAHDCSHLKVGEEDDVTCTITNTYHAPESQSCTVVSDSTTTIEGDASTLTFVHPNWTTSLVASGAKWIWKSAFVDTSLVPDTTTFVKKINVVGTPSSATLEIAADNTYTVDVNGTAPACDGTQLDNFSATDTCPITLHAGVNTITFTVTNTQGSADPQANPAGLLYKVSIQNASCAPVPTTPVASVSATKVVCTDEADLPNWGAGGPDITATTATNWVAEHKSCSIVPWDFQWTPSSAGNPGDNVLGTPEGWSAFVSGLATVPANALVWVREKINGDYIPFTGANSSDNVSAEMYCSNDVLNYDNFDFINPVEAGHTYYCVGFNTPKAVKTTSSSTVVVSANTSAGENLLGWMFNRDTSTQTPFEFNTDASSIGTGSLFVKPITNTINGNNDKFVGELFLLTPISGLNNISYDFKIGAPDVTAKDQFYMNVYANFGESSPTKFYDCRYNVVPTVGSTGAFTTVTFDPTQSYPVTTRGTSPHPCPASPSGMQALSASGTAVIRVVALNVGDTSGSDTGVSGYFDKVVTSITTGLNTHTTTYDFEPVDMCTNIQGAQTTVPEGMTVNDGVCSTPEVVTPTITTPTTGGGRSGGRSHGGGGGSVLGAFTTGGQVLGESCGLYMEKYLRLGSKKNDADQTKKLQTFLNKWMKTALPITGTYGPATEKGVKAFQAKYADDILTPWNVGAPTGLVYFTTLHKINELECPEAAGEKPSNLIDWSKNKSVQ